MPDTNTTERNTSIEREIHKTEFINKELPTVTYEKHIMDGMDKGSYEHISVSDETSEKALKTLKELKTVIK